MSGGRAGLFVQLAHATVKKDDGCARFARGDFDVLPGDAACPACLQRLERRFFGGEACGIMLRGDGPAPFAVSSLPGCEYTFGEARRAQ